jgi:hypothetical protein
MALAKKRPAAGSRAKISATVAPKTLAYLEKLVEEGQAATISQAVDLVVEAQLRRLHRDRLEQAMTAYFEGVTPEEQAEEAKWADLTRQDLTGMDWDREP